MLFLRTQLEKNKALCISSKAVVEKSNVAILSAAACVNNLIFNPLASVAARVNPLPLERCV